MLIYTEPNAFNLTSSVIAEEFLPSILRKIIHKDVGKVGINILKNLQIYNSNDNLSRTAVVY